MKFRLCLECQQVWIMPESLRECQADLFTRKQTAWSSLLITYITSMPGDSIQGSLHLNHNTVVKQQAITAERVSSIQRAIHNFRDWCCHLFEVKCIQEVVFCEGVQHRLRFFFDHLSWVELAAIQFCLQLGTQRKVCRVGKTVMLSLVKKNPW
jgi:hypothetical protein